MFAWLRRLLLETRDRIRYRDKISSDTIRTLAMELRGLTDLAERLSPAEATKRARIKRIRAEVSQLTDLTQTIEFHRLPAQRRLELHDSLILSKEQILDSMKTAPVPTERIQ